MVAGAKISAANHGLFLLAFIQKPSSSPPGQLIRTKDTPITWEITRVSGSKTKHKNQRWSQCSYHLGSYKGLRSSVSEMQMKTKYIVLVSHNFTGSQHPILINLGESAACESLRINALDSKTMQLNPGPRAWWH